MIFSNVSMNPKDHEIMTGAEVYRERNCDLILSVGGGSPMDCAKGIGIVVGNDRHILEFEGVDEVPNPGPPLIFIPTTAGSSADVSQFSIISDSSRRVKSAIISKMAIPDIALVDPQTTTMSAALTAATGMDALCHSFEAYVSTAASAITDMAALRAVRLITDSLVGACTHPMEMIYRDNMMMASLMAGLAFSNASLGIVHAMAHSLGGLKNLGHGECNAVLLEAAVRFNFFSATQKYTELAMAMGIPTKGQSPDMVAKALTNRLAELRRQVGIASGLKEMGVLPGDIPQLAENAAMDPCLATNPCAANKAQIAEIYEALYR